MATATQVIAEPLRRNDGLASRLKIYPEASGQSFVYGAPVYLSGGQVTACADDATNILGFAQQAATTTENSDINVLLTDPDQLFACNVYKSGDVSNSVTSQALVGGVYEVVVSSGKMYCDFAASSNAALKVHDLDPRDTVGDLYGKVQCTVYTPAYGLY